MAEGNNDPMKETAETNTKIKNFILPTSLRSLH